MEPIIQKIIRGVMLYARDLEGASQWYYDNLGFSIGDYDFSDFVELTIEGEYVMHLFKSEEAHPVKRAVFAFNTKDIQAAHRRLMSKGVDVDPIRQYGDHADFTFKDLDGNVLMICQYD